MSNKPEEDEATAARASPDIKPILAPPIPPIRPVEPAAEAGIPALDLRVMWLGTGELVNMGGFDAKGEGETKFTVYPAPQPEHVIPTFIKPSGSMTYTVQKGANTIPASILSAVTALFRPGSQQGQDTEPRKAG